MSRLAEVVRRLEEARARPRLEPDASFGHPADSGALPADRAPGQGSAERGGVVAAPRASGEAGSAPGGAGAPGVLWEPPSPRLLERTRPFRLTPPSREEFDAHLAEFLKSRLRRSGPLFRVLHLNVSVSGGPVLHDVELEVNDGEVVALVGPEGAGKTVLLDALCGLRQADGGRVYLGRDDLSDLTPHQRAERGLARTFEDDRLFASLSVVENLMVAQHARLHGGLLAGGLRLALAKRQERAARHRALEVLDLLGLAPLADARVASLDLRQARLVGLGRALAADPELALLDDPGRGLAPGDRAEVGELLAAACDELGVTLLVAVRQLSEMVSSADHVYVLEGGRIAASGPPEEIDQESRSDDLPTSGPDDRAGPPAAGGG